MNEEPKDRGLRKAVSRQQPDFRLPSNFAYRTMRKVEEAARLREKKTERRTLWATIAAALFLTAVGAEGVAHCFGDNLREALNLREAFGFLEAFSLTDILRPESLQVPSFYLLPVLAIPLFVLFDRWMRKQYFKRRSGTY